MHVHASQFNPNAPMHAIYAARAEAKLAAARTRKKLIFSASALANEVDEVDCVVSLSGEGAPRDHSNQQDSQNESCSEKENTQTDAESNPFSDWA
jgi:hypothetical protein